MICTPIIASTTKEAVKELERVKGLVELRLDFIRDIDLKRLLGVNKKKIVTCRKRTEGGKFVGSEKKRIGIIKKALDFGPDFIDLELSCGKSTINKIKKIINKNKLKTKLIISFHNLKKTNNKKIKLNYNKIKKLNPDIIKIVTFANSIDDNIAIFDLIRRARKEGRKIIALCMGEKGQISRILSPVLGAELTFGSLAKGKESAPGQITADVLRDVYRVDKLKNSAVYGLVGNPVGHSKGYVIHNTSFSKLGLNKIYVNFLVDDIKSFIKKFKSVFSGLSITIPHKRNVVRHLGKVDGTARRIGAVNTVVKKNGKLIGYNTDCSGALKAIGDVKGKKVLVVGAGGVARAIAFGVKKEKGKLIILNRTVKKAIRLGRELKCKSGGLDQINRLKDIDILINCTSIGMFPKVNTTIIKKIIIKKIMNKKGTVFDTVYNPVNTKLLKDAKSIRLKTITGVELFVNQAAEQFRLWTGKRMPNVRGLI